MSIEEGLKKNGYHASTTSGYSMYPLLRDRRDNIVVRPCSGRLKKYDVPLYKRGNEYVLHRIIKVLPDGYVICGDNCINKEYNIKDENILGVLTEVYRNDKYGRFAVQNICSHVPFFLPFASCLQKDPLFTFLC